MLGAAAVTARLGAVLEVDAVQLERDALIAGERPRVPRAVRRRHPRVVLLQADGAGEKRARVVALIGDGRRRYTLSLELGRWRAGWRVMRVGS